MNFYIKGLTSHSHLDVQIKNTQNINRNRFQLILFYNYFLPIQLFAFECINYELDIHYYTKNNEAAENKEVRKATKTKLP